MFNERKILSAGLVFTIMLAEIGPYALDKFYLQHLDAHNHPREAQPQTFSGRNIMAIETTQSTIVISGNYA